MTAGVVLATLACLLVPEAGSALPAVASAESGPVANGAAFLAGAAEQAVARAESQRPLVHVLLAYAFAWVAISAWTWRIARLRKRNAP